MWPVQPSPHARTSGRPRFPIHRSHRAYRKRWPIGAGCALHSRRVITFGVNYIGEGLGNPDGSFKPSTYYDGRLEIVVEAEMEKVVGW